MEVEAKTLENQVLLVQYVTSLTESLHPTLRLLKLGRWAHGKMLQRSGQWRNLHTNTGVC